MDLTDPAPEPEDPTPEPPPRPVPSEESSPSSGAAPPESPEDPSAPAAEAFRQGVDSEEPENHAVPLDTQEPVGQPVASSGPMHTPLADGSRRALPERAVAVERQAGWITMAVILTPLAVLLLLGWLLADFALWLDLLLTCSWITLAMLFLWLNLRFVVLEHGRKSWRLSPESIDLWQGVVWRRVTSIPRKRVQHTDVSQGPLQRSYDLATLSIHTAGTEYAKVDFSGLDHATALEVRDFLLDRAPSDGV